MKERKEKLLYAPLQFVVGALSTWNIALYLFGLHEDEKVCLNLIGSHSSWTVRFSKFEPESPGKRAYFSETVTSRKPLQMRQEIPSVLAVAMQEK